ncbi:Adenine nucleotide alpha hydrolases-like superfamily protein [Euphorbia peplus]|nr:Adenine nucleotide alpha hydrolases-like superfamily protein [Euphorbia peplus]
MDNATSRPSPTRKVMLVAEPTRESAGALQYAISHVVLENDVLILLHVENPYSWRNTFSFLRRSSLSSTSSNQNMDGGGDDNNFLDAMINVCEIAHPKVSIRTEWIDMENKGKEKDKANAILDKSEKLGADIIIIGQKRSLSSALLGHRRPSSGLKFDTAEYLIEKSKCTCVAVQKKGQNAGYVLNSKTHKNFWLLA